MRLMVHWWYTRYQIKKRSWKRSGVGAIVIAVATDVVGHLRAYKRVMNGVRVPLGKKKKIYTLHKELE